MAQETPYEAAQRLRKELGDPSCIVCILGGTKFQGEESEALVKAAAKELSTARGDDVKFVTGGMAGVQETFAKHCGDGSRVSHLLPVGESSGFGTGTDIHAGADLEERKAIFGQLGNIYVTVEGGPGVSQEARAGHERGAAVIPLRRTGGASGGMFDFPAAALEKPTFATDEEWDLLGRKDASTDESAAALAAVVKACAASQQKQPSFWELIDELIGVDRSTLTKALGVVLTILVVISGCLIYREIARARYELALLHGGFLFLVFGLIGSVAWVVSEASRLEDEKKNGPSGDAALKKEE